MPVICADPLLDEDSLTCTSLDLNAVTYNAIQYIQIDKFSPTGDRSLQINMTSKVALSHPLG